MLLNELNPSTTLLFLNADFRFLLSIKANRLEARLEQMFASSVQVPLTNLCNKLSKLLL